MERKERTETSGSDEGLRLAGSGATGGRGSSASSFLSSTVTKATIRKVFRHFLGFEPRISADADQIMLGAVCRLLDILITEAELVCRNEGKTLITFKHLSEAVAKICGKEMAEETLQLTTILFPAGILSKAEQKRRRTKLTLSADILSGDGHAVGQSPSSQTLSVEVEPEVASPTPQFSSSMWVHGKENIAGGVNGIEDNLEDRLMNRASAEQRDSENEVARPSKREPPQHSSPSPPSSFPMFNSEAQVSSEHPLEDECNAPVVGTQGAVIEGGEVEQGNDVLAFESLMNGLF